MDPFANRPPIGCSCTREYTPFLSSGVTSLFSFLGAKKQEKETEWIARARGYVCLMKDIVQRERERMRGRERERENEDESGLRQRNKKGSWPVVTAELPVLEFY